MADFDISKYITATDIAAALSAGIVAYIKNSAVPDEQQPQPDAAAPTQPAPTAPTPKVEPLSLDGVVPEISNMADLSDALAADPDGPLAAIQMVPTLPDEDKVALAKLLMRHPGYGDRIFRAFADGVGPEDKSGKALWMARGILGKLKQGVAVTGHTSAELGI